MSPRRLMVVVLLGGLVLTAPARAALDKCELGIGKATGKLDGLLLKGLQKCTDAYRKAVAKGTALSDVAAACEGQLEKATSFPSTASAMGAAKTALDALVSGGTCTDADLHALGHLPVVPFGDTWSRTILVARLGAVYAHQVDLVRDTGSIFRAFDAAGGCPLCADLVTSPCATHTCRLGVGTSTAEFRISAAPPIGTAVASGQLAVDLCRADGILPGDLVALGGPTKTLRLTNVLGATPCLTVTDLRGYVTCGASAPRITATMCQDHAVAPAPAADDCATAGFTDCAPTAADQIDGDPSGAANKHVGTTNGGACTKLVTSAASAGDAIMLASVQLRFVRSTQVGPDGVACTADDTAPTALSVTLPLTTATAAASLFDVNLVAGSAFTTPVLTGARFSCNNLQAGSLNPGKLVAAAPLLHALCTSSPCDDPATAADEGTIPLDGAVSVSLSCQ